MRCRGPRGWWKPRSHTGHDDADISGSPGRRGQALGVSEYGIRSRASPRAREQMKTARYMTTIRFRTTTRKVRAEWKLRKLRQQGNVELVILRPGIVFGPRSQWTAGFADDLLKNEAYLVDGGHGICNSIYVDNLVHAIHLALTADSKIDGEALSRRGSRADHLAGAVGANHASARHEHCGCTQRCLRNQPGTLAATAGNPHGFPACRYLPLGHSQTTATDWSKGLDAPDRVESAVNGFGGPFRCRPRRWRWPYCTGASAGSPTKKARRVLGYEPKVSFEEACGRCVAWCWGPPAIRLWTRGEAQRSRHLCGYGSNNSHNPSISSCQMRAR